MEKKLHYMSGPKILPDEKSIKSVYKACQNAEKLLEEKLGIDVCWVSFTMKGDRLVVKSGSIFHYKGGR